MLQTNLKHLLSKADFNAAVQENKNVMICCGRMGPMCIPVYDIMDELQDEYKHVAFFDMEFDAKDAEVIRNMPECRSFMGLPFVVYLHDGKVAAATSSIQTMDKIKSILDKEFSK
ncbi:MAG TPA: hypothetical protein DCQ31_01590 [Bacteroidales bacterium]|nr:hypothetical protein [Bacteroidales bacterium]